MPQRPHPATPQRLSNTCAGQDSAERGVAGGDALGHADKIRHEPVARAAEVDAQPAEAGHDLVDDEQYVVLAAQGLDAFPVSPRRGIHASGPPHLLAPETPPLPRVVLQDLTAGVGTL